MIVWSCEIWRGYIVVNETSQYDKDFTSTPGSRCHYGYNVRKNPDKIPSICSMILSLDIVKTPYTSTFHNTD